MAECIACDTELSGVTHRCRYCEEPVCSDHRLPENHDCIYQSMAEAPSTKGVADSATESSAWAGVRDILSGNLPGQSDTDSSGPSVADTPTEETQKKTPPRKDTSDPDRATFGSTATPPDRSDSYPDDERNRIRSETSANRFSGDEAPQSHPAEAATERAPGARRDAPTAKSPAVETTAGTKDSDTHPGGQLRKAVTRLYHRCVLHPWWRFQVYTRKALGGLWLLTKYLIALALFALVVIGATFVVARFSP